jgi:hypothetical protein
MSKRKPEVLIERLKELQQKLGDDAPLSAAIEHLQKPAKRSGGAPIKWTMDRHFELYVAVELLQAHGRKYKEACEEYAKFAGLTYDVVEWRKRDAKWGEFIAGSVPEEQVKKDLLARGLLPEQKPQP